MKEDDIVVLPLKTRPDRIAIGRITGQYAYRRVHDGYYHTRTVNWIHKDALISDFGKAPAKVLSLHDNRTISQIKSDESKRTIVAYLNKHAVPESDTLITISTPKPQYTLQSILQEGCFLPKPKLQTILSRLKSKKNLILQGPPGTGKTWLARRLAYALIGHKDDARVRRLQFHPNLSYEDFIRGLRPNADGRLDLVDGPFLASITQAVNDPDSAHVIVIEEINRGNPAQIFGEMLTLLEADKRNPDEALILQHPKNPDERVHIPPNLHVIGTMNIADRSIALVDLALRRRFAFIDLVPNLWRSLAQLGFTTNPTSPKAF